jgi:hypothetical protein
MSTDVRAAHQLGIGHVQAWAAGERRKVLGRPEFARRIGRVSTRTCVCVCARSKSVARLPLLEIPGVSCKRAHTQMLFLVGGRHS